MCICLFHYEVEAERSNSHRINGSAGSRKLVVTCELGALSEDMMQDHIVEKTSNIRIRECLLLEDTLKLDKTLRISVYFGDVVEAKTIAVHTAALVSA